MSFNIGLTGIRAADADLRVTGNNIANASTTGFKRSRAEFGDVYANSMVGASSNATGSGVALADVAQQFVEGNTSFTDNVLDLSINGSGFFVMSDGGDISYTRSGAFSTDDMGYIINNTGFNLQGYAADNNGNIINGVLTDLRIDTSNQAPQQTTNVTSEFNLDATDAAPAERVTTTSGTRVLQPSAAAPASSQMNLGFFAAEDFTGNNIDLVFDVDGATQTVTLNGPINSSADLQAALAGLSGLGLTVTDTGSGVNLSLDGAAAGANNNFTVTLANATGTGETQMTSMIPSITSGLSSTYQVPGNGYQPGELDVISTIGTKTLDLSTTPGANATARQIAEAINLQEQNQNLGITASARTQIQLSNIAGFTAQDLMLGVKSSGSTVPEFITLNPNTADIPADGSISIEEQIVRAINSENIPGVSASINSTTGAVEVVALNGEDLILQNNDTTGTASLDARGVSDADNPPALNSITLASGNQTLFGGEVDITVDDGIRIAANSTGGAGNVLGALRANEPGNTFDPENPETYNAATSVAIYDSLGNAHVMTQYFVKERTDPADVANTANNWSMYVTIDGQNVGNPEPGTTEPTLAKYDMKFSSDGSLVPGSSGPFMVSNWTPLDENGNYNGSMGPNTGGVLPIPTPAVSSNFELDILGTTQFGSDFSVDDVDQNGYSTGRLSGINIDDSGIVFARFTNGQAQVLGQVALADFTNEQGLQPQGNSSWIETSESGPALIGAPQTAALGLIQSGALEDSNVDISEELVNLIIAQRNYQSNAKTIETADQVTQTILNI